MSKKSYNFSETSDVDTRDNLPALNVKVYSRTGPPTDEIVKRFKCSEADAEHALELAYEKTREEFWSDTGAQEFAREVFGDNVKVFSAGRSDGWLTVQGIGHPSEWNRRDLKKWQRFANRIADYMAELADDSTMMEDIEANEWYRPGSELYNFIATKSGGAVTVAELKAAERAARERLMAGELDPIRKAAETFIARMQDIADKLEPILADPMQADISAFRDVLTAAR